MIKSLVSLTSTSASLDSIDSWIKERNHSISVSVDRIPFSKMTHWKKAIDGSLQHESGKFFSVEGIRVKTDYPTPLVWSQPIINQPEIGYLGIICKEIDGVIHFLMQAKVEPGNVNNVQISPTLQATKSNYTQVHGGRPSFYLDLFRCAKPNQIVLDQLQSEQGARFLRKRNRNIIVKIQEEIPVYDDFRWMTLGQIKELMCRDNCVNMDTRTVIAGIDFSEFMHGMTDVSLFSDFGLEMLQSAQALTGHKTMREVISWLTNLKASYDLSVEKIPLNSIEDWLCTDEEIVRYDKMFFRVLGVRVSIDNREVFSWCQPLIQPMQQGICAFIVKRIEGVFHFLVQAKLECGNIDVFELAPTVQCLTGSIYNGDPIPPFTNYVLQARDTQIIYDVMQSEEGGRFYREQNRNMIVVAEDDFPMDLPPSYQWMTLGQINEFMRYNNFINIQARSLIAAIKYI